MEGLWQHALLAIAVACVAGTGWRVASLAAPGGGARVVATAVLATAAVVIETLALGLLGLSDSGVALVALAAAGLGAAVALTPAPALSAATEARTAWAGAGPPARMATGALLAVLGGWMAWQLVHPNVGFDGEIYHLPISAAWAQDGHAGSVVDAVDGLPVGNYPITNEVIVSWALSLSRSWVMASLWSPLVVALLVLAGWVGLRALRVGRGTAALGLLAYVLLPIVAAQLGGPLTDVPCSAWLVASAALCAASRQRPGLLPVAVVAAALSFGTKTTGSVLLLVALGLTLWWHRGRLRLLARPLALALGAGVVVGGLWTLRNTVDHGSPLWPFVPGPFGDPLPRAFVGLDDAFLDHPRSMLDGRTSLYLQFLSGGVLLLAGGVLAPLLARTRQAWAAGGLTLLALLVWGRAPFTGIDEDTALAVGAVRYLLPALAMAVLSLCIAARDGGRGARRAVGALFVLAAFVSSSKTFGDLGFPYVPSGGTVTLLAVAGAAAALLLSRVPRTLRPVLPALAVAGAVVGLAAAADGYVQRQTEAGTLDQGVLRAALADPWWRGGDGPIHMGPLTAALLRGDRLDHPVSLLRSDAPCRNVRALPGWKVVVTARAAPRAGRGSAEARRLLACLRGTPVVHREENFVVHGR